jgi:hypothetical protein
MSPLTEATLLACVTAIAALAGILCVGLYYMVRYYVARYPPRARGSVPVPSEVRVQRLWKIGLVTVVVQAAMIVAMLIGVIWVWMRS